MSENGKDTPELSGREMALHGDIAQNNGGLGQGDDPKKDIKYPKHIFFIIVNEFCERFSYYGMRTVLPIYLKNKLNYTESESTVIYHCFLMINYFFPVIGAIVADSVLGRYKTIFYLSIVYALGNITLASSSAIVLLDIPHRDVALLGLFLIALGSGGIKPCVSSFGGDQFVVPEQEKQLQQFFSIFYFSINVGSMFGTLLSPILRQDVHCLGEDSCFPLAFALPALLMITAIVIFVLGKSLYLIRKPQGNVLVKMCSCISYALKKKITCDSRSGKVDHWLELASDKYEAKLINETKIMLSLALMLSPCIFFWALFEQTGSRWTFQASRMDGHILGGNFDIKPDQLHIINPILVLLIIPLFQKVVYPCLASLHLLRTQLQKMVLGGILTAIAFFMSGALEMYLQPTYAVLPKSGEAQLRIFNGYQCPVFIEGDNKLNLSIRIEPHAVFEMKSIEVLHEKLFNVKVKLLRESCAHISKNLEWEGELKLSEKQAVSYFVHGSFRNLNLTTSGFDNVAKSENGNPKLRIIHDSLENRNLTLRGIDKKNRGVVNKIILDNGNITTEELEIPIGDYELIYPIDEGSNTSSVSLKVTAGNRGVYRLMISNNAVEDFTSSRMTFFALTPPSNISMLWMVPQFIVITIAEVLFSVTALEFAFMQAPFSMKSVASSMNLLCTSLGNLVVVFIEKAVHTDNQAYNFFTYGGLMIIVMFVFAILAINYKYVDNSSSMADEEPVGRDNINFEPEVEHQKNTTM